MIPGYLLNDAWNDSGLFHRGGLSPWVASYIWSNFTATSHDLTPNGGDCKGNPIISGKSRLVKYHSISPDICRHYVACKVVLIRVSPSLIAIGHYDLKLLSNAVESHCLRQHVYLFVHIPSLKLTFLHLKMDGWKTILPLGRPIFRCYVSFLRVSSIYPYICM